MNTEVTLGMSLDDMIKKSKKMNKKKSPKPAGGKTKAKTTPGSKGTTAVTRLVERPHIA